VRAGKDPERRGRERMLIAPEIRPRRRFNAADETGVTSKKISRSTLSVWALRNNRGVNPPRGLRSGQRMEAAMKSRGVLSRRHHDKPPRNHVTRRHDSLNTWGLEGQKKVRTNRKFNFGAQSKAKLSAGGERCL